ncbi:MAG: hypothetical protein ACU0DI_00310 [Paracoccaceae bacterium]
MAELNCLSAQSYEFTANPFTYPPNAGTSNTDGDTKPPPPVRPQRKSLKSMQCHRNNHDQKKRPSVIAMDTPAPETRHLIENTNLRQKQTIGIGIFGTAASMKNDYRIAAITLWAYFGVQSKKRTRSKPGPFDCCYN